MPNCKKPFPSSKALHSFAGSNLSLGGCHLDFILGFPRTQINKDSIYVVVDHFSKMAHFTPWDKINNETHVVESYINEVMRLDGIPRSVVLDQDTKFLIHFWVTLWTKMGTKLKYNTTCHPQMNGQTEVTNRTLGLFWGLRSNPTPKLGTLSSPMPNLHTIRYQPRPPACLHSRLFMGLSLWVL